MPNNERSLNSKVAKRLKKPLLFVSKVRGRPTHPEFLAVTRTMRANPVKLLRALIRAVA
jgi:hypothetical protein